MQRTLFSIFVWMVLVALSSCKNEPCKNVHCNDHGIPLEDGSDCVCLCDKGWEGDDCSIPNLCSGVKCVHGECVSETGSCLCESGYEGDSCNIFSRDKFLNVPSDSSNWNAKDTCAGTTFLQYSLTIKKSGDAGKLILVNFYSSLDPFLVSLDKKTFEQYTPIIIDNTSISGLHGVISEDHQSITVNYQSTESGVPSVCSGVWTREP